MTKPIHEFLLNHADKNPISFHMPGHKGSNIYKKYGYHNFLEKMMDCDVTEIPGADNLFQAETTLKEVQDRYADLYEVQKSYILINGTSGGLIAAIMATVPKGKKLLMARNCHKSVFNALMLAQIQPVYAYSEMMEDYGITGQISVNEIKRHMEEDPDIEAVILPSPNYYGICSDIKAIADVVHSYGKILIVDQAHGAHLKMFSKFGIDSFPKAAEDQGADIVVNSIHKTLASYTQSALLNVTSDRVNLSTLEDKLQSIESTSPSYILMSSLSINEELLRLHGKELMAEWKDNLDYFYNEAKNIDGLLLFHRTDELDWTKINFGFPQANLPGNIIEDELMDNHNLFIELYTGIYVMCMSGIGNTREHYDTLLKGLAQISAKKMDGKTTPPTQAPADGNIQFSPKELKPIPVNKEWALIDNCVNRVSAGSLIPYPPGIPLICPGEVISESDVSHLKALRQRGEKVIGINANMEVLVGK